MQQQPNVSFAHFLEKFPEIDLPLTLTSESSHAFSRTNDPLHSLMIEQFILPYQKEELDEFTEFIPCFKIPKTFDIHAIVYWKASLLNYQYILATYNKKGQLIDKGVIAGTYSDGASLISSVATIEEDWIIYIISGKAEKDERDYDATSSKAFNLELLATGEIVTSD